MLCATLILTCPSEEDLLDSAQEDPYDKEYSLAALVTLFSQSLTSISINREHAPL